MDCIDTKESVCAKREFVAKQTKEAKETGYVTIRGCGKIPLWIAFRCLYCGEYFNQSLAEAHFGMTRCEFFAEQENEKMEHKSKRSVLSMMSPVPNPPIGPNPIE